MNEKFWNANPHEKKFSERACPCLHRWSHGSHAYTPRSSRFNAFTQRLHVTMTGDAL
jgi:hypothetical protein